MATVADMQVRMDEVGRSMPRTMLRYAQNLLCTGEGKQYRTQAEAYVAAGYKGKVGHNNPAKIAQDPRIREFLDLGQKIATRGAIEALEYDKAQWLWDTVDALNMALGRTKMVTTTEVSTTDEDGNPITEFQEREFRAVKLPAAARLSEILGKHLGVLTEKKLIGEDPDKPLNSLRALGDLMRDIADTAQKAGPVRDE